MTNQIAATEVVTPQNISVEPSSTRRGTACFKVNPYLSGIQVRTRRITNKRGDMTLINSQSGEVQSSVAGFWESEVVDATRFLKLFVGGVRAMTGISNGAGRVFELVLTQMQASMGQDKIYMTFKLLDQGYGELTQSVYTRGVRELILRGFIAPSENQGWYWINPSYIWNGDKIAFVKQYTKASSDAAKAQRSESLMGALEAAGQQRLNVDTPQERIDADGVITHV